jgi:hypothetical protein
VLPVPSFPTPVAAGQWPEPDLLETLFPTCPAAGVTADTGFASSASTIDLKALEPGPQLPKDGDWKHTPAAWWFDTGILLLISTCYLGFVRWKIRLKRG